MLYAFKDKRDGYYQCEVADGMSLPEWTKLLTPCDVVNNSFPENQVPQSIEALQALLAIDKSGLTQQYEQWINSPSRTFAQKAFIEKAQTWKRNDPTLIAAAADLGMSSSDIDQFFILAATL